MTTSLFFPFSFFFFFLFFSLVAAANKSNEHHLSLYAILHYATFASPFACSLLLLVSPRAKAESRGELHRLRLPGRILQLVNTDVYVPPKDSDRSFCCDPRRCCCCCCCCLPQRGGSMAIEEGEDNTIKCPRPGRPASRSETAHSRATEHRHTTKRAGGQRRRIFTPVWVSPDELSEIRVSPAFLSDHNPDEILPAVQQTLDDLGILA